MYVSSSSAFILFNFFLTFFINTGDASADESSIKFTQVYSARLHSGAGDDGGWSPCHQRH